jgi:16S rRNA (cytosine1402-N4)-methyltransferase
LDEVLAELNSQPGQVVVDCTVGWAGHGVELLRAVGEKGRLIGLDLDKENLPKSQERLAAVGFPFVLHQSNFAGLPAILAAEGLAAADAILADLGMSSMQLDNPDRGFSYVRDGPLDMRMDRSRGRTAAHLLATITQNDLRQALEEFGDESEATKIAAAVVSARQLAPIRRTSDLSRLIMDTIHGEKSHEWRLHPAPNRWNIHPAARTFQALRILVNRELANLKQLLRVLPTCLVPGGKAAIISFHSGEDRLVKSAFRAGLRNGVYSSISQEPLLVSFRERTDNPRARSAKLRWVQKGG